MYACICLYIHIGICRLPFQTTEPAAGRHEREGAARSAPRNSSEGHTLVSLISIMITSILSVTSSISRNSSEGLKSKKCVYIYIYIYTHVYIYLSLPLSLSLSLSLYVYTLMYIHVHMYVYIYMYFSLSLSLYIYIYIYMCMHLLMVLIIILLVFIILI